MRDKISHYLQQHISGEVMTAADALDYFSTDASVLEVRPKVVVYPRSASDVRKVCRFTWQLAERGYQIPVTARGNGTDLTGAALGEGIILVFPAHMNKILALDKEKVVVQSGTGYAKLTQALNTHYRFLPPYPSSFEYSSVGGAIANNASGEKSVKYGDTRAYTAGLHVVLANGELIETRPLNKRELNKKQGQSDHEGAIYRAISGLIDENQELINRISDLNVDKNSAGYALHLVKSKQGFDLTPLLVGSQGTLGIITEATMRTEPFNPRTSLSVGFFKELDDLTEAVMAIRELAPSTLEIVDDNLLNFVHEHHPAQLPDIIEPPFPRAVLLIELDDLNEATQRKKAKKLSALLDKYCYQHQTTTDDEEKDSLWKIRHSAAAVIWQTVGTSKALPFIEDGVVPVEKLTEFMVRVYDLFRRHHLEVAIWGHAGQGNLHLQPYLDLSSTGDRQRLFKLADDYYDLVVSLGGTTTGEHGDGRMRAPYLKALYGDETVELFEQVKKIFDPFGTLNPGVKLGTSKKELQQMMRKSYTVNHLYDHMPRT